MKIKMKFMKKYLLILVTIPLFVMCSSNKDVVVIDISGERITSSQFKIILKGVAEEYDKNLVKLNENMEMLKRWVIDQLINEQLLIIEAKKRAINISSDELNAELKTINPSVLKSNKLENDSNLWEARAKKRLLARKAVKSVLTDIVDVKKEEIDKYYRKNIDKFQRPDQCRFRQIITKKRDRANEAKNKLEHGDSFIKVVDVYDEGPYHEKEGDTGYIDRNLLPSFLGRKCDELDINEISDILESPYGFCIVKLLDRRKQKKLSLDEAKDEINNILIEEKGREELAKWLSSRRKEAVVVINWEAINEISN